MAYVDGFNLYFGLKAAGFRRYYWLDLPALADTFVGPGQVMEHVHYFTARIKSNPSNVADALRQSTYLDALSVSKRLTRHEGHFLEKTARCNACGATWTTYEEKMSDVNLAVQLVVDAANNNFDTAFVISGDSDLSTPINRVLEAFPLKRVIVAFPPKRHSAHLARVATTSFAISQQALRQSQLPDAVLTAASVTLARPGSWR